jgi:hypothetical protein
MLGLYSTYEREHVPRLSLRTVPPCWGNDLRHPEKIYLALGKSPAWQARTGLLDFVTKNTGYPVKFGFQINKESLFLE